MTTMIVVCGDKKRDHRCKVKEMYIGNYFTSCMNYAKEFGDKIFIISVSAYGLLDPEEFIEPYDSHNILDSSNIEKVRQQVRDFGIDENEPVIVLGGKKYVKFLQQILPEATSPLKGGLLSQIKWLNDQVRMSKERKQLKLWQS